MPTFNASVLPSTPGLGLGRVDQEWAAVLTSSSTVGGLQPVTIVAVPTTATSTGTAGSIAYSTTFLYVCVAANTWRRVALATF